MLRKNRASSCAHLCNDSPTMAALDAADRAILDLLRRNGRATVAELASATGLSASACSRRLRRLEDQRVIRGYRAIIDPKADGRGLTAFVAVRLVRHQREHIQRFQEGARKIAEIVECHHVTGNFDYLLRVEVPDLAGLRALPRRPARRPAQRRPARHLHLDDRLHRPLTAATRRPAGTRALRRSHGYRCGRARGPASPGCWLPRAGGFIDLDNWRRRHWRSALEAAGLSSDLTPYAMRHTYASYALDAGVTIFELARLIGTSVKVIDDTYGHLVRDTFDRVRRALEERARREAALSSETRNGSAGSS